MCDHALDGDALDPETPSGKSVYCCQDDEPYREPVCDDCHGPGPLVATPGGGRVCRDCWMGENWGR